MDEPAKIDSVLQAVLDRGFGTALDGAELEKWEAERTRDQRLERLERSGIAPLIDARGMEALVRDELSDTRALSFVRAWLLSPWPVFVLLSEQPGLGKTVSAGWALTRHRGRYASIRDLCELRYGHRRDRELFRLYRDTELLVIDELGLARSADEERETIHELIDRRQRRPRRTLLLGNLSGRAFNKRYDARTLDRLGTTGDSSGIAIRRQLKGESLRGLQ